MKIFDLFKIFKPFSFNLGFEKTSIGIKIVRTLLCNRKVWQNKNLSHPTPILVLTHTLTSLDPFLEQLIPFVEGYKGMIRCAKIGNEKLQKYLLCQQRKNMRNCTKEDKLKLSAVRALFDDVLAQLNEKGNCSRLCNQCLVKSSVFY